MQIRPNAMLALFVLLGASRVAAQAPWTVTIRQTANPLPIGTCHTVSLTVYDPATKGNAKNASGGSVSSADFDMSVESVGNPAAVGKYEGTIWSACACQSATVGQRGTITATYPADAIKETSRVAGVAFKTQVPFTFGEPQSKYNAAGCDALKAAAAGPGAPAVALPPTLPPVTLSPAPAPPPAVALPAKLQAATLAGPTPVAVASGPPNFRVLPGASPVLQVLAWDIVQGVAGYNVYVKRDASVTDWTLASRKPLSAQTFADSAVRQPGTLYRVTALYADGRQGSTDIVYTNPPQMHVPAGFTASHLPFADKWVRFRWATVAGAKGYRLMGYGMPPGGQWIDTTGTKGTGFSLDPPWKQIDVSFNAYGTYTWQVTADYGGAYQTAGMPTAGITLFSPCDPPQLAVAGPAPDTISLVPFVTASGVTTSVRVVWPRIPSAVAYTVERENYTSFGSAIRVGSSCVSLSPFVGFEPNRDPFSAKPASPIIIFQDGSGGLVAGSGYRYKVTAFNAAGQRGSKTAILLIK